MLVFFFLLKIYFRFQIEFIYMKKQTDYYSAEISKIKEVILIITCTIGRLSEVHIGQILNLFYKILLLLNILK